MNIKTNMRTILVVFGMMALFTSIAINDITSKLWLIKSAILFGLTAILFVGGGKGIKLKMEREVLQPVVPPVPPQQYIQQPVQQPIQQAPQPTRDERVATKMNELETKIAPVRKLLKDQEEVEAPQEPKGELNIDLDKFRV